MRHLVGFYQSVDQSNAAGNIDAMDDNTLYAQGKDVRIPEALPFVEGAAVLTAATTLTSAQIRTPSLRKLTYFDIEPAVNADNFASPIAMPYFPNNPIGLVQQETMNFNTTTDNAAAVAIQGFVWLCDGPQSAVNGEIFTVRCTAEAALEAGVWQPSNLTFTQALPYGGYEIVGMRALGTNLQAARIVFVGGAWKPGVPASTSIGDYGEPMFRYGRSGTFGAFDTNTPPSIECCGHTDNAQTILLDLIKIS